MLNGDVKRYFDLDLLSLRNYKYAFVFIPTDIPGYIFVKQPVVSALAVNNINAAGFPFKLYLYAQTATTNALDYPV